MQEMKELVEEKRKAVREGFLQNSIAVYLLCYVVCLPCIWVIIYSIIKLINESVLGLPINFVIIAVIIALILCMMVVVVLILIGSVYFVPRSIKFYRKWRKWRKIEKNLEKILQNPEIEEAISKYETISKESSDFKEIANIELKKLESQTNAIEKHIKDKKSQKEAVQKELIEKIERTKF